MQSKLTSVLFSEVSYTVGARFTAPSGEYFNDYVKRSVRCFEYFFVCLVLIGLEIRLLYNGSYIVSMVRYIEVRL